MSHTANFSAGNSWGSQISRAEMWVQFGVVFVQLWVVFKWDNKPLATSNTAPEGSVHSSWVILNWSCWESWIYLRKSLFKARLKKDLVSSRFHHRLTEAFSSQVPTQSQMSCWFYTCLAQWDDRARQSPGFANLFPLLHLENSTHSLADHTKKRGSSMTQLHSTMAGADPDLAILWAFLTKTQSCSLANVKHAEFV